MELLADPDAWISLATLTVLEIVLGIDNLVFIAVMSERVEEAKRARARQGGIAMALVTRLLLLASLAWIIGLTEPIFTVWGRPFSWRDIILIGGGIFLLVKATNEIHDRIEGEEEPGHEKKAAAGMVAVIVQIAVLDIIFSLDSVITAIGMVGDIRIMAAAIIIAVVAMLVAAAPLSGFIGRHPTVKMLAFSFLILIGMALVADGMGFHIPRGYLYFAVGFSIFVEGLNLMARRKKRKRA